MEIDDKIRDEKLQYGIYREEAKISILSSGKTDKYEYLTGERILPLDQRRVIEQAKFAYSKYCIFFWKTHKNDWIARKKQIDVITDQNKKRLEALTNKDDHKSIY